MFPWAASFRSVGDVGSRETAKSTVNGRLESSFDSFVENIVKSPGWDTRRLFDLGVGPANGFES